MPATSLGRVWGPIWETGAWIEDIWAPVDRVRIGRAWGEIWAPDVWAEGVWSQDIPVSPVLVPQSIVGIFEWSPVGGDAISVLKDNNDSTYITADSVGAVFQCTLTDGPPYNTIHGATIRLRVRTAT